MKTSKLIIGIISIVLPFLILFQSCAATAADALTDGDGTAGFAGILVSLMMLIAGIVSVATRKSSGGSTFCLICYALAGVIGITMSGIFADLKVWGGLCILFALIFLFGTIRHKKEASSQDASQK